MPNALTLLRIALVPLLGWVLLSHPHDPTWRIWAVIIFLIASLTDVADGKIARRYGLVTTFGKLWDPVADKALTGMAFIGLGILSELYWWMIIVILLREWGITIVRAVIKKHGVMAANRGGKLKTLMQTIALSFFLVWLEQLPYPVQIFAWICMWIALILTVVTGLDYLREAARIRRESLARHE